MLFFFLITSISTGFAQARIDVTSPPIDEQSTTGQVIKKEADATNQFIANKWDQFNRTVDTFFTNEGSNVSPNNNSIFLSTSFTKSEGNKLSTEHDFQLKLDLPNTTKKLKIVIEKQSDEISDALSDNAVSNNKTITQDGSTVKRKSSRYTAGANYFLAQSKHFVSYIHFGVRLDLPLNPNLKLDFQKLYNTRYLDIGLLQKFIVYRQEGFQEISQLALGKRLNQFLQADLVNSLVYSDETDLFVLRNNFVLTQDVGHEKKVTYSIGANAQLSPTFHYTSYDTSVSYRQLLYNNWLYGTLAIGANFPKSDNFNDEKFVQIKFDVFFKK